MIDMFEHCQKFTDREGQKYHLVRYIKPHFLLCWKELEENIGNAAVCDGLNVRQVETSELRRLEVWDKLSAKVQEAVKLTQSTVRKEERVIKSQRGRKKHPDYIGLPKNLICKGCGKKAVISPGTLLKKADEAHLSPKEYVKTMYQCRKCKPKKNPDAVTKITCSVCEKPKGTTHAQFLKQLTASGLTKEEFLKTYVCKKCRKQS
jgi:hypothetical protein